MPEQNAPSISEIVEYYSRADILHEMMKFSKDREFVGAYKNGSYYKRPNIIQFPTDITQMAKSFVTSFHCSVERWNNPMMISTQTKNYNDLRKGFDILIDIDSKVGRTREEMIRSSQLCASIVCGFFRDYVIKNYGVKFSGSRGFHILIPWEALPHEMDYKETRNLYPILPQAISGFMREKLKEKILEALVKEHTARKLNEMVPNEKMDPYNWVEIENGWGERHLFRSPYSLNEKTWLVSLPLKDPMDFQMDIATMKNAKVREPFLKPCDENEALELVKDALNWAAKKGSQMPKKAEVRREFENTSEKIPEEAFPPCVKNILKGLEDGKKRSVFTLINFLRSMNWSFDEIEKKILEWNSKNPKPLPQNFILGQINWNKHQKKRPPANCQNDLYYKSIGICTPDQSCARIKNPVTYPFKKMNFSTKKREKPAAFTCRICKKPFANERSLRAHQSRTHGESMTE